MEISELIKRVRRSSQERNLVMSELYLNKRLKGNTMRFVMQHGGTKDDAETVFTDTVVSFVKNCYRPDFEIQRNLNSYFLGVTKYLWYRTFRKKDRLQLPETFPDGIEVITPESEFENQESKSIIDAMLSRLDAKCRELLQLWALNMKMHAIAEKVNLGSAGYARKKKHFCLKKLMRIMEDHPEYSEFLKSRT